MGDYKDQEEIFSNKAQLLAPSNLYYVVFYDNYLKSRLIGLNIMNRVFGDNPYDYIRENAKEIDKEASYRLRIKDRPLDKRYTRNYTKNFS